MKPWLIIFTRLAAIAVLAVATYLLAILCMI